MVVRTRAHLDVELERLQHERMESVRARICSSSGANGEAGEVPYHVDVPCELLVSYLSPEAMAWACDNLTSCSVFVNGFAAHFPELPPLLPHTDT